MYFTKFQFVHLLFNVLVGVACVYMFVCGLGGKEEEEGEWGTVIGRAYLEQENLNVQIIIIC